MTESETASERIPQVTWAHRKAVYTAEAGVVAGKAGIQKITSLICNTALRNPNKTESYLNANPEWGCNWDNPDQGSTKANWNNLETTALIPHVFATEQCSFKMTEYIYM